MEIWVSRTDCTYDFQNEVTRKMELFLEEKRENNNSGLPVFPLLCCRFYYWLHVDKMHDSVRLFLVNDETPRVKEYAGWLIY